MLLFNAKPRKKTRIVTCSGSCQIITAISILEYRSDRYASHNDAYENYLVIYSLGQKDDLKFANFITELAINLYSWEKIVYISPFQIQELMSNISNYSPKDIFSLIYKWVGLSYTDELYCNFNWLFENRLFMHAYKSATKICYGDSIGIYYSVPFDQRNQDNLFLDRRFLPNFSLYLQNLKANLLKIYRFLRNILNISMILNPLNFDFYYLYLNGVIGDTPPKKAIVPPSQILASKFARLHKLVDRSLVQNITVLAKKFPINILLTSCLSEANRMTEDDELLAYSQFINKLAINYNSILVIKPHPRDSSSKLNKIHEYFGNYFQEVIVLSQSSLFFLPFEVFFYSTFVETGLINDKTRIKIIAFSSACLSLKFLYGVECHIGFGTEIIQQYFKPEYVIPRLNHEAELLTALSKL